MKTQIAASLRSTTDPATTLSGATELLVTFYLIQLPRLFIVAPLTNEAYSVYSVRTVPANVFDAWFSELHAQCQSHDLAFDALIDSIDRRQWSLYEKWWAVNALADHGVLVPLYGSARVAQVALSIAQQWDSEVRCG